MTLAQWHDKRKSYVRPIDLMRKGPSSVTVITYIYGDRLYVESNFFQIENAIRETWFHLGMLQTVIVTSVKTPAIEQFENCFSHWIRVDICNSLKAGDLYEYSRDCIKNLHTRFDTPYMLFVHPDGFPLRGGISEFLGCWDYIGAPWCKSSDDWIGRLLLSRKNFVGNGGFSLRSHEICEKASYWYQKGFKAIPNIFMMYEDIFFTRVLTKYVPSYRNKFVIAPPKVAARFAIEQTEPCESLMPLGFHSAKAFEKLSADFPHSLVE